MKHSLELTAKLPPTVFLDCLKKLEETTVQSVCRDEVLTSGQGKKREDYGRGGGPKRSYRRQDQGNKRRYLLKSCYKNQKHTHRDEKQSSN